ncbi:MAG: putative membrane protein [Paraglaciecola sp.]|jgi:putative membrane protein
MNKVLHLKKYRLSLDIQETGIKLIWLFHLSAMVGISIGFFDFFIPKTFLNLSIAFLLLLWIFPINSIKKISATLLFFSVGMLVEYLGVNYGLLFGTYEYGANLGLKFKGVPWLIGVNWAILVLITGAIANRLKVNRFWKVIIGASLMILLDLPMEVAAPIFDFWEFAGGVAPLQNFIAWFLIAAVLHVVFQGLKITGNFKFSLHLYICQFIFFTYFYVFYSL